MLKKIRKLNPTHTIRELSDNEFLKYGRLIENFDFSSMLEKLRASGEIQSQTYYVESTTLLADSHEIDCLSDRFFGGMPTEVGFCLSKNRVLNALEYHKSNEIMCFDDDVVLMFGVFAELNNNTYEASKLEAFFAPARSAIELYAGVLHYAPFSLSDNGFRFIVILPMGTNSALERKPLPSKENEILIMKNKWIICHSEAKQEINDGVTVGITGGNIRIKC